jgi:hypothetical protein
LCIDASAIANRGDERGFGALPVVLGLEQYRLALRTDTRQSTPS